MCFSAEASFIGGTIISGVGVASVAKANKPQMYLFAAIPLFFGVQQLAEGTLWLQMAKVDAGYLKELSTYLFLLIALVLWPLILPLSIIKLEKDKPLKKYLYGLLFIGCAVSIYFGAKLILIPPEPQVVEHHIKYRHNPISFMNAAMTLIYVIATIVPLILSSIKHMRVMATVMFVSSAITAIVYVEYFTSVWCFFAAILSGVVYWIIRQQTEPVKV